MLPALVLSAILALPSDAASSTTNVLADAPFGYVYQPAFDLQTVPRFPAEPYCPKAGDVLLLSDTDLFWTMLYRFAFTGKPGHAGLVVTMPDGRLGILEAGYDDSIWTRVTSLDYRLSHYLGTVWVRPRLAPLSHEEDRRLTEFAMDSADKKYAWGRFMAQLLVPLRTRGPLRTYVVGRPNGIGHRYQCAEATVEALVYAGLIDARTARPAATFPQDLFYDRSWNRYIDRHPPLAGGWGAPQLWTPVVGYVPQEKGKSRSQSPRSGVRAYEVDPLSPAGQQPATPVVIGNVSGELRPIAIVQQKPQRIGVFDRPPRLFRRR